MNTELTDESNGRGNVKQTRKQSSSEAIEILKVEDTPFTLIRKDKDWYVMLGKYRLTEGLKSKGEALKNAQRQDWNRIMQVIAIMIENKDNLTINK